MLLSPQMSITPNFVTLQKTSRGMNKHVKKYAGNKAVGLFEQDETIQKLQTMGNPLEVLSQVVDFEVYRDILEKALLTPEEEKKVQ